LNTQVAYIVYIIMMHYKIAYSGHFILQSVSADSVREAKHNMQSSQHSTRSCIITHFTQRAEGSGLQIIHSTWEVCVSQFCLF